VKKANSVRSREAGFSLIELLVVILIIGILASIAIPSFLNQRRKGQDACAKSMARTMQTAMETYYLSKNTYGDADVDALNLIESQITSSTCGVTSGGTTGNDTQTAANCSGTPGTGSSINGYCVSAQSKSGVTYAITRDSNNGNMRRTCTPAGTGTCSSAGSW
jgi:type IV pilus assembly protein PilA